MHTCDVRMDGTGLGIVGVAAVTLDCTWGGGGFSWTTLVLPPVLMVLVPTVWSEYLIGLHEISMEYINNKNGYERKKERMNRKERKEGWKKERNKERKV